MINYEHTFYWNHQSFKYTLESEGHDAYYMCYERHTRYTNHHIFRLILASVFPKHIIDDDHELSKTISKHWASSIVGYEITSGDWPTTITIEDCIKLCVELDRVIAMSDEDRTSYLTNLLQPVVLPLILTEF